MLKGFMFACVLTVTAVTSASAQLVLFSGAGYVTAATPECGNDSIFATSFMLGAYLPAGLGDNGEGAQLTHTSLPQFVKPHATAVESTGPLTAAFQRVNATTITPLEVKTYKTFVRVKSRPAVISEATQNVDLEVSFKNAHGFAGCDFTLNLSASRRP